MGLRTSRSGDGRSDAAKAVCSLRNTIVPPELKGETLKPERLAEAEGTELRAFIKRKRAHGNPGIEPLDAKEERHFETLVGKAAGDERLFARKHKEREAQEKVAAASDELRIASLPRRLEYAEPGSIALPRFVFDWLQNPEAGSLDLPSSVPGSGFSSPSRTRSRSFTEQSSRSATGSSSSSVANPLTGSGSYTRSIPTTAGMTSARVDASRRSRPCAI